MNIRLLFCEEDSGLNGAVLELAVDGEVRQVNIRMTWDRASLAYILSMYKSHTHLAMKASLAEPKCTKRL